MTVEPTTETAEQAHQDALVLRARELYRQVDSMAEAMKGAAKALKDLSASDAFQDPASALGAMQKLEKVELPSQSLRDALQHLSADLRRHLGEEERRLKFAFGKTLREAAAKAGVECSLLTTDPPEFRIGLCTVAVDFAKRSAIVRYARNDLIKVDTRPESILDACRRQVTLLEGKGFDGDAYFQLLWNAYQGHVQRLGQPLGTRVDIVDLLADVAFLLQGPKFLEDPVKENSVPYSRVQLAFDLARLRRLGKLSHKGLRLSLGSATGGSTRQKNRVMYLEDERGNGQYFLSLRFARDDGEQSA